MDFSLFYFYKMYFAMIEENISKKTGVFIP